MLEISCARCGRKHFAGEEHLGKQLRCAGCGDTVPIAWQDGRQAEHSKPLDRRPRANKSGIVSPVVEGTGRGNFRSGWGFAVLLCLAVGLLVWGHWASARYSESNPAAGHAGDGAIQKKLPVRSPEIIPDSESYKSAALSDLSAGLVPNVGDHTVLSVGAPDIAVASPSRSLRRAGPQSKGEAKQVTHQEPAKSLPTGTPLMEDRATTGRGELEAINGTHYDACVIVVDADSHLRVRKRYIKAQDSLTLDHLDRGEYTVLFATGVDWNDSAEEFNREASYFEFGKSFDFVETSDSHAVHYVHHSITLHSVLSGNIHAKPLTKAQFHALAGRT